MIDNTEDESGLMINAECQTDSPLTTEFEMQTEITSGTDAEIQMCMEEYDEKSVQTEAALKTCETQTTELDSKPEMKTTGCQAESPLKTSETQIHIEAHMKEVQTYFCREDKETQAPEADTSKLTIGADEVQAMEFQGSGNVEDKHPAETNEQSVETDLHISMSTKLEVVEEMHSWGMQTNIVELSEMQLIISRISDNYKDASETDSLVSSTSCYDARSDTKSEEMPKSQSSGLDMRRGEYKEVTFPPVPSMIVTQKPMEPTKERTPSPVDLCTTSQQKEKKKKLPKVQGKMPASCTVSEDPRDVLHYVPKSSMTQLKLTPAHQSFEGPCTNPTPAHISRSLGALAIRPPDNLRKKKEDEALFHQQQQNVHEKESKSMKCTLFRSTFGADENVADDYGMNAKKKSRRHSGEISMSSSKALAAMLISNSTPLFGRHQAFGERSAFSSLQRRLSPVMDSPLSCPSKEQNLQTFHSLFTESTPSTRRNIEKAKMFNWQQSMVKTLGKHSPTRSQKKSEDDSAIDLDCSTFDNKSTEKRGIKMDENVSNEEDKQLIESSQEVAKKMKYAENKDYDDDSDDGDLSLSVDGDYNDDGYDMLSTDEEIILMGDDVRKKTKTSTELARKIDVNIAG